MKTLSGLGLLLIVVLLLFGGVMVLGVLAGLRYGAFCWDCALFRNPHSGVYYGSAGLKVIASAQADLRGNDRDGNGQQDYWRGDIAGLYAVRPNGSGSAIQLVELSLAGADDSPVSDIGSHTVPRPKAGFWYRMLLHADEDPSKPDPNRFAACMYPADHHAGKSVFIINQENTIYKRKRPWSGPGDVPAVYPDPATLQREWSKLD